MQVPAPGSEGGSHVLVCGDASPVPKRMWKVRGSAAAAGGNGGKGAPPGAGLVYTWDAHGGGRGKAVLLVHTGAQVHV